MRSAFNEEEIYIQMTLVGRREKMSQIRSDRGTTITVMIQLK